MTDLQDKSIIIVGLGREGLSALEFLKKHYPSARLAVADKTGQEKVAKEKLKILHMDNVVETYFGEDYLGHIERFDVIVKTAGLPLKEIEPYIGNATLSSATQLFFDHARGTIIGITGTKGKSTTATLIYEVLKRGRRKVILCGNIGVPALDFLPQIDKSTLVVMELSSHQLQTLTKSPHIAVLQNITPEHLDYYDNFQDYTIAKERITKFQSTKDYLLYNAAFPLPYEIAQRSHAKRFPFNSKLGPNCCYVENGVIIFRSGHKEERIIRTNQVRLLGQYNLQNVMPSIIIGQLFHIAPQQIAAAIGAFKGLEDRLEYVGNVDSIDYYNDTLATIPEATIAALETLGDRVETLLVGGFDRGLNFTNLAQHILVSQVKNLVLFPTTGQRIWDAIEAEAQRHPLKQPLHHYFVNSMPEAVALAKGHTAQGKICLLSPASPSFGLFKDYHDRAVQFKQSILGQL